MRPDPYNVSVPHCEKLSTAAFSTPDFLALSCFAFSQADYSEVKTNCLGLLSPACSSCVLMGILVMTHNFLVNYGRTFLADNRLVNSGGWRSKFRNTLEWFSA